MAGDKCVRYKFPLRQVGEEPRKAVATVKRRGDGARGDSQRADEFLFNMGSPRTLTDLGTCRQQITEGNQIVPG
jgi:hypothetical protein